MLKLQNLIKFYKAGSDLIKAVDNLNLTVDSGDFLSIMGHSGSGKTTLLSLIAGLTRPYSGMVEIAGTDIWSISDSELSELRNKKIGFIYQFASLVPTLSVIENILLPTVFNRDKAEDVYDRAKKLLEMFGIGEKESAYSSELSGGQQRRVAIARAFINRPEFVLADEPTGDLDNETASDVIKIFQRINKEEGCTFIIVTHSSELAGQANKRYRMSQGSLQLIA